MRWVCGVACLLATGAVAADEPAADFFEARIRPVLVERCLRCHGRQKQSSGFRVDSRDALLQGGENGAAIVPGKPDEGLLLAAIEHREGSDLQMPPDEKLSAEVVADFKTWIQQGAIWPAAVPRLDPAQHWAFQPVKAVEPPAGDAEWSTHPIDRFLAEGHRRHQLQRAEPASRHVLIRRLYFDLHGLPPSPEQLQAALADGSADAWPKLVDQLLESPRYGERWGRHWMDIVRYADTAGDNADYPVPEARLYRDYIIDSFQADKPFDQFLREQLAGDLLAAETARQGGAAEKFAELTVATGFLALSRRYATGPYELWHLTLEDTIDTVGRSVLGLAFKCARCHDHKFDPVTMDDYYGLYGIFASTEFPWAGGEEFHSKQFGRKAFAPLSPPESAAKELESHAAKVKELQTQVEQLQSSGAAAERIATAKNELRDLLRRGVPAGVPCAYAVRDGAAIDVPIQHSGDPGQPGAVVPRHMPRFLNLPEEPIPAGQSGRLQLANWLTRLDHPLTARVMVNRIWQHHFGQGLVATPSNFGTRGEPPSHPQLLDFLAGHFVSHGWSVKSMHRLMLTSRTWQFSSTPDPASAARDPGNRYLAHFPRRRLDAEAIRDAILACAGTLSLDRPGEHPFPDIKTWTWTQHAPFTDVYPSTHRSVYLMTQRLQKHPYLALFDGPDTNTTTDQRTSSIVPLQALFWMNSPLIHEQSASFGRRMAEASADDAERVRRGFLLALSREPQTDEISRYVDYLRRYREELAKSEANTEAVELEAWSSLARILLSANEFLYLD